MISYFSEQELACKCCGAYNVDPAALEKLTLLRETLGRPLYINSACRCPDQRKFLAVGTVIHAWINLHRRKKWRHMVINRY